jgi:hypothetical protein
MEHSPTSATGTGWERTPWQACQEISMAESEPGTGPPHYDRDFLLSPGKRNQVMALWEVEKFGTDSFGDPDYVSIYGMQPADWYTRGVRLLARTTLEAVRDQDVERRVVAIPAGSPFGVIDPFAGSCNGLYWVLRHVPNATARGFELDETVFALTSRNLTLRAWTGRFN